MSTDPQEIIAQAIQSARYNEAVVVTINNDDGGTENNEQQEEQTREIVLVACLDSENGGIIWKDAATTATTLPPHTSTTAATHQDDVGIVRHLRTKRWALPMLNDHRRNELYNAAIRSACRQKVAEKNDGRNNYKRDDNASPNDAAVDDNVVRILDIGSGSGLLAMMGAKYTLDAIRETDDADVKNVLVTSVEMASAMARLARMTIEANDLDENIQVVEKHSMDENFTLDQKADICTSELLESGLLGEGVLPSIRDAWSRHLKDDAVVIPRRARVFAVLVEGLPSDDDSNDTDKTNKTATDFFGPNLESFRQASGGVCLSTSPNNINPLLGRHDQSGKTVTESNTEGILVSLHASSLLDENYNEPLSNGLTDYNDYKIIPQKPKENGDFLQEHRGIRALSQPQSVLDFDFESGLEALPPPTGRSFSKQIMATSDGNCNGVLFWWELDLGDSADSTYSTKPIGFFSDSDDSNNWQDHWQQNLFLFGDTQVRKVTGGHPVEINVSHDDSSISFAITNTQNLGQSDISRPIQRRRLNQEECTMNRCISSTRALQLNDTSRIRTLRDGIEYALETKGMDAPLLDLSDMGVCALIAAAAGATRVTSLESSSGGMPTLAATIAQVGNNFGIQIIQAQAEHVTISYILGQIAEVVTAEPYYEMLEGWSLQEALNYYHLVRSMKERGLISPTSISVPSVAVIMAVVVEFDDFSNAYGQVGDSEEKVLGCFDHTPVNFFGNRYHTYDVSLPVSEYKYKALSDPFCVAKLLYDEVKMKSAESAGGKMIRAGNCQGVIFYVDYLCRVSKEKATHHKDGAHYVTITTSSAYHRQVVRKLQACTVATEADVQKGAMCFCKASFDDIDGIEDHSFAFKIVK